MADENKSAAEIAREERKARIGKAGDAMAEKKEKKANQSKAKRRAKWLVPLAVAVVALALVLLYYFGVPHRTLSVAKFSNGTKVSVAEYEYFYKAVYNNVSNTAYQYEQYYSSFYGEGAGKMMTGFDYTKTPKNQEFTLSEEDTGITLDKEVYGEHPTWADFLTEYALKQAQETNAVYKAALKAGTKLSDEDKKEIENQIEELRKTAADSNYSLNAYLMANYGRGMNESLLRKTMTKQAIASAYINAETDKITAAVTDDDIRAYYDEHKNDYNKVDLRYFTIAAEPAKNTDDTNYTDDELAEMTKKTLEEKKAEAEAFYNEVTLDNFTNTVYNYVEEDMKQYFDPSSDQYNESYTTASGAASSDLSANLSEDVATWAYDESRAVGDKFMTQVEDDEGCVTFIIVVMKSLPERDDTLQPVSVRHILFALTKDEEATDDQGNKTTEKKEIRTPEEARAEAEATLDAWVASGAKEDDFSKIASEKSEDPGSADNGGLIEDIYTDSSYVEPFLNWAYADGRKVGDYGVVDTDYGSHVMYMSSISDRPKWMSDIASTIATDRSNDFYNGIVNDEGFTNARISQGLMKRVQNRIEKYASKVVSVFEQQSSASADAAAK